MRFAKKSHRRECVNKTVRRYCPKHRTLAEIHFRNKTGRNRAKINRLFEGKRSGTHAPKNAADPLKCFR